MEVKNYVISIGRQMGSGGSAMGKVIAERFGFSYIDREILSKAAELMDADEENLGMVDEKNISAMTAMAQTASYEMPYISKEWFIPTSEQLFEAQTKIMRDAVKKESCVIIGRCSSHMFRNYEKHVSIFLHADMNSRMERLKRTLKKDNLGEKNVNDLEKSDRRRAQYYNTFTGKKWLDLRNYDFALDTTPFSDKQIEDILVNYITARFPELKQRAGL